MKNKHLKNLASKLRQEVFKSFIIKKEAHLGGAFSMIEILISIFEVFLKRKDKFILSKSHSSFPLILYLRKKGFKAKFTVQDAVQDIKNALEKGLLPDSLSKENYFNIKKMQQIKLD